jgi:hypothetical protein
MQTLTGTEYLMAEIACKHDKAMEKKTWDERLAYFRELMTFPDLNPLIKKASDPIGMRAALIAWNDTAEGKASGYNISLDACSSGLQILSLLVSCPQSYDLCGGVQDQCIDSYTKIYDAMELHGALTRKQVKNAIMTSFYGSNSIPERTFLDNIELFYETIEAMAPGAWDLNKGLQELWDEIDGATYSWTLPDNFHACIETKDSKISLVNFMGTEYKIKQYVNSRPDFHKGLGPNLIHSVDGLVVREMFRRCMFNSTTVDRIKRIINEDTYGPGNPNAKSADIVRQLWDNRLKSGFLSVRILDHLYEDTMGFVDEPEIMELINSLPAKPFELVSVHDCFRCHPNYGNDLRRQYNRIMADINDSNLLEFMAKQVAHDDITINKVSTIDRDLILNSNYMLA